MRYSKLRAEIYCKILNVWYINTFKRPKKRYIVFEVLSSNDSAIYTAIRKSLIRVLGAKYEEAGIMFLKNKYKPELQRGVFRVKNKYAKAVVSALSKDKSIKTIGMSGVLKKAEEKYLRVAS